MGNNPGLNKARKAGVIPRYWYLKNPHLQHNFVTRAALAEQQPDFESAVLRWEFCLIKEEETRFIVDVQGVESLLVYVLVLKAEKLERYS